MKIKYRIVKNTYENGSERFRIEGRPDDLIGWLFQMWRDWGWQFDASSRAEVEKTLKRLRVARSEVL